MMALGAAQLREGRQARRQADVLAAAHLAQRLSRRREQVSAGAARRRRGRAQRGGKGSAADRSRSAPSRAAAQAYVDGRFVGVTPNFAEGLPVGEHWVTLKKEGYKKAVMAATASAKMQQTVSFVLERSSKYLLVEQALHSVEKSLGAAQLDGSIDNLKEVLFVDHGIFVRVTPAAPGFIHVDAFLYDLRTRKQLARVTRDVNAGGGREGAAAAGVAAVHECELRVRAAGAQRRPAAQARRAAQVLQDVVVLDRAAACRRPASSLGATLAPKPKECPAAATSVSA